MEEALRAGLLADAGMAARVGTRVTWVRRPQASALPAVTLQVISAERDRSQAGQTGLGMVRVQADCWGATYEDAKRTAREVEHAALALSRTTRAGVRFQTIVVDSERDGFDAGEDGRTDTFRTTLDLLVWRSAA